MKSIPATAAVSQGNFNTDILRCLSLPQLSVYLVAPAIRPKIRTTALIDPIVPSPVIHIPTGICELACPMHPVILPFSGVYVLSIRILTCTHKPVPQVQNLWRARYIGDAFELLAGFGLSTSNICMKHLDRAS